MALSPYSRVRQWPALMSCAIGISPFPSALLQGVWVNRGVNHPSRCPTAAAVASGVAS